MSRKLDNGWRVVDRNEGQSADPTLLIEQAQLRFQLLIWNFDQFHDEVRFMTNSFWPRLDSVIALLLAADDMDRLEGIRQQFLNRGRETIAQYIKERFPKS